MNESVFIRESPCPYCGYTCDGAMNTKSLKDEIPKKGDVSICIRCTKVSEFTEDLQRRVLSVEQLQQLSSSEQTHIYNAMIAIRATKAENVKKKGRI